MSTETKIAPTAEAIDAWLAQQPRRPDGSIRHDDPWYMVNIWTVSGRVRCINIGSKSTAFDGTVRYRAIRGVGNSSAGRTTLVREDAIVRAVGIRGGPDAEDGPDELCVDDTPDCTDILCDGDCDRFSPHRDTEE
jgi:hypothetical protein